MKKLVSVLLALLTCIAFTGIAQAGSTTSNLSVSANVVGACQVSTTSVDFGDVIANESVAYTYYANGDVSVNCVQGTAYHIALDAGQNFLGVSRWVNLDGNLLPYRLFQDAARSTQWGDADYANTYPYGSSLGDTGSGSWQSHTVYSYLTVFSGTPTGYYTDNVVVTVYW